MDSAPILAHFRTADGLTGADLIDFPPSPFVFREVTGARAIGTGRDPHRQGCGPERARRYSLVRWDSAIREAWYREVAV